MTVKRQHSLRRKATTLVSGAHLFRQTRPKDRTREAEANPVRLLPVGKRLPHQHPEAPDVALAGELVVVDALRGVPLHGPLPVRLRLKARQTEDCVRITSRTPCPRSSAHQSPRRHPKCPLTEDRQTDR